MNFNIYLDDQLGEQLVAATKDTHKSRNAVIREAIALWLKHNRNTQWPDSINTYEGIKDFPAFESHREHLKPPKEDPFEGIPKFYND